MVHSLEMQVESALLFETPEQIYARVFHQLRPRTPVPAFDIAFRAYANANSFIRVRDSRIEVRITDLLESAPSPIHEALAWILLCKLFRRSIPKVYSYRYRRYLNGRDMCRSLHIVRRVRGRKSFSAPQGGHYDLDALFSELNRRFFHGLMIKPVLGWSVRPSRTTLGHYDLSHNAIILSRLLDSPLVPRLVVEYVLFHEMLHLAHPVEHHGSRRRVHTASFRRAESQFPDLKAAKQALKTL